MPLKWVSGGDDGSDSDDEDALHILFEIMTEHFFVGFCCSDVTSWSQVESAFSRRSEEYLG